MPNNPFPPTAVARLSEIQDDFWSIETDALKQARIQLRDYLTRSEIDDEADFHGAVFAIVGDYGTGKTHIAQEMLRMIVAQQNPKLHPLYLDAPSDTFLALYKERFINKLNRADVLRRVDDYYCDIVADELQSTPITQPVADALRKRLIFPDEVVRTTGLSESIFSHKLASKLKSVTERSDFGTSLFLLRRPEFQAAVWEWLQGAPPDPILQERGVRQRIDSDAMALEAIGVMAFLFGHQKHRFILFIDEIEKVLSHSAQKQPEESAVLALKKLMEAVSKTRALLILMGLPEFLEFLPDDAKQRISCLIRPSSITADEIEQYIFESQRRATGNAALEPFTRDTVEYLAEIAGGNARKTVRLCYHAYVTAKESGGNVSRAMLRELAREQFEQTTSSDVAAEIVRCVESRGWLFERDKKIKKSKEGSKIDFWLPYGDSESGTAIFLTRSILQESECVELISKVTKVPLRETIEILLVVNGYLADNLKQKIESDFTKVLVYKLTGFREDLVSILSGMRLRLEQRSREDMLSSIRQRVDEIARQNTNFEALVRETVSRSVSRTDMQAVISTGLRGFFGKLASADSQIYEGEHPRVSHVFNSLTAMIEQEIAWDVFFDNLFGVPNPSRIDYDLRDSLRRRGHGTVEFLFKRKEGSDVLMLLSLIPAIRAFRRGVFALIKYAGVRFSPEQSDLMGQVGELCENFDNFANSLSISDTIIEYQKWAESELRFFTRHDILGQSLISAPKSADEITLGLRRLGERVYRAVREEIRETPSNELE